MNAFLAVALLVLELQTAAPNVVAVSAQGNQINLNSFHGKKNVLLVFYRTETCGSCRELLSELQKEYPRLQAAQTEVVAISTDGAAAGQRIVKELNLTFPVLSDSSLIYSQGYGVLNPVDGMALASVFIIDKKGTIAWKQIGKNPDDSAPATTIMTKVQSLK